MPLSDYRMYKRTTSVIVFFLCASSPCMITMIQIQTLTVSTLVPRIMIFAELLCVFDRLCKLQVDTK